MSFELSLMYMSGASDGRALRIAPRDEPPEVTFGRDATCDLSLVDDPEISRFHARMFWSEGGWWIEDLTSTNGTFVGEFQNAERVTAPRKLESGSIFRVGLTRFRVEHPSTPIRADRTQAEAVP